MQAANSSLKYGDLSIEDGQGVCETFYLRWIQEGTDLKMEGNLDEYFLSESRKKINVLRVLGGHVRIILLNEN